ncbi:MAG: sugar phosphate nucleotidyltransferase [Acidobacteriota bacterium]|nr:sugar phosphate nucleotidyltransferase [Acidobacteriota bacterium]
MNKQKVLALILAGGKGGRLGLLTENKAKPVMPFGGFYRLIDFALSNCLHSGISDVWVVEQYELHSLNEHLANGRPWDLDRTYGGLQILPPFQSESPEDGFAEGNADAIVRHLEFIADFNPDLLIVLSADHVYKLDFRDVIETHLNKKASVTMVTTRLPKNESASRFGVVETDKNGRITKFEYKPDQPKNNLITAEVFVYDAKILIETLKKLTAKKKSVKDYGHELLPHFVKSGRAFEHRHTGYWRDVGTIESFWQAHMELLDEKTKFVLDDKVWQILTLAEQRVPAFIYSSADIKNSLISLGCKIKGSVEHSVLSANVLIETGAAVRDSVVLPNAIIEAGVKLEKTIVDSGVKVTKERIKKIEEIKREDKNAIMVVGKYKVQSSSEIED